MFANVKHMEPAARHGNHVAVARHVLSLAVRRRLAIELTIVRPGEKLTGQADRTVSTELPRRLPAMQGELAIWRAFLSNEIDAIIRDDE